ncbi:MAG TPA: bi-domain-containing oxidoreductase, partial [Phototrophicaceae bacterium]|nr:bi-domain-containing oxidoreductase [Phototrophicaceae bacterium]
MRQLLQNLRSGELNVAEVPAPTGRSGQLLIATRRSLVSAGTERMLVEFAQANLVQKALAQPERVRQVMDKMRTDGVLPTMEAVFAKLDEPLPLGYCNAGVVVEVGSGVEGFAVGDRVVSNGPHAEIVSVSKNLCARIPDAVDDDSAAFTVLAAVGLEGIRLAAPTLGERVVVVGLGLIGLLTVQMLIANGCQVLGIDFDEHKLALARHYGAQTANLSVGVDPVAAGMAFSQGRGVDAVLVTASSKSDDIIHQAAQMSRKRGRIILVGVVGLSLSRADFYEKELTFQVSCSYGPGRYDDAYEQGGSDYPFGFVRWTEQRNFEAVLGLMVSGKLDLSKLISTRIAQSDAPSAYRLLTDSPGTLGIVLTYPTEIVEIKRTLPLTSAESSGTGSASIGMIGVGNFGSRILLPALASTGAKLATVASAGGTSAAIAAEKFHFAQATSDYKTILADPSVNTLVIATRHDSHARMVVDALRAGKHVFVEKPLALNRDQLDQIEAALRAAPQLQLLVGYNRRFAPLAV